MDATPTPPAAAANAPLLSLIGACSIRIFGLTGDERLRRQFARAGLSRWVAAGEAVTAAAPAILIRADALIDQPLIAVLTETPGLLLLGQGPDGETVPVAAHALPGHVAEAEAILAAGELPAGLPTGLTARAPGELNASFWKGLRKRETPYAFQLTPANAEAAEWRSFMGTYKGATDLVTKRVWPLPAFLATRFLSQTDVTPNMVTTVGAIATVLAFWLFLEGHFGTGLIAAWLMTFLDTVDGKLARTTLTSSKWGDIFDHGIDLVHPPFWYAAWGFGLAAAGFAWSAGFTWAVIAVILAGYVAQRLMEGAAIAWLGMEIHIWRKRDTFFREITARRNPNLLILSAFWLAGRPDAGLIAVAAYTLICLVLHGLQLAEAFAAKRRDGALASWMSKAE